MATRVCPHCYSYAHFTRKWSDRPDSFYNGEVMYLRFCEVCDNCDKPVCGYYPANDTLTSLPVVWPVLVSRKSYPDVPGAIATAASEAHQALEVLAPRASVAMARATIEATAKDKGITRGSIQAKIEQLAADGHISEAMKEAAHEIRLAGNEAAHGLVEEPISVEEAMEVVELMDAILERVYQEPAKVERVRASRTARRSRRESGEATS